METIIKKENIIKMLNSEDRESVGVAEELIGVCKYPEGYWVMPDYYCPGTAKFEKRNKSYELSPVDKILFKGGFFKEDGGKKYQNIGKELSSEIEEIEFYDDNTIALKDVDGNMVKVDFGLLCCIFVNYSDL